METKDSYRKKQKEWKDNHKEHIKKYSKDYYKKNKVKIYQYWKAWSAKPENKKRLRDYYRHYQRKRLKINPENYKIKDGI